MKENSNLASKISLSLSLLFIGTMFLLSNFGYIHISDLLSIFITYWPVLIILAGFKIILNVISYGKVLEIILDVILYLTLAFLLISFKGKAMPAYWITDGSNTTQTNYEYTVPKGEEPADPIEYNFKIGASKFDLSDSTINDLLQVKGTYFGDTPEVKLTLPGVATEKSRVNFTFTPNHYGFGFNFRGSDFNILMSDSALKNDVNIELGAGEGVVTLKNIGMETFSCVVGAGDLETHFDSVKSSPKEVTVKVGAGNVSLYVPKDVKISLTYSVGAGMISVHNNGKVDEFGGLARSGSFTTESTSSNTVKIIATVGAGNIDIYND